MEAFSSTNLVDLYVLKYIEFISSQYKEKNPCIRRIFKEKLLIIFGWGVE